MLLVLGGLLEAGVRLDIDVAQARAVFDDALAMAADATAAIDGTLVANGFARDGV